MTMNTMTMKQIPEDERPYEKCLTMGPGSLSDAELLSVLLRSGSRGENVHSLARRLLDVNAPAGLTGLYHMSLRDMMQLRGIGRVKAVQLQCVGELSRRMAREEARSSLSFSDPSSVAEYYMEAYRHADEEHVLVVMLDSRGHLIAEEEISKGTVRAAAVSPREIFICALKHRAVSVILLHNHPSGDPSPSDEDVELTRAAASAGSMLGIRLLDHIIIGDQCSFSFRTVLGDLG